MKPFSVVFLVLYLHSAAQSPPPAPSPVASGNPSISLTISTKQQEYKVGESILVNIVRANISDARYCESHALETGTAELNGYNVTASDDTGSLYPRIKKPFPRGMRSTGRLCLEPGQSRKEQLVADSLVNMSQAGIYHIQVNHLDREAGVRVVSNTITVTVHQE
jgi:hypothetical protein